MAHLEPPLDVKKLQENTLTRLAENPLNTVFYTGQSDASVGIAKLRKND
jgi:hypothetical protein